jgi:hypothetical protein
MRKLSSLILGLMLSGCVNLGAKPQLYDCAQFDAFKTEYVVAPIIAEIQKDGFADLRLPSRTVPLSLNRDAPTPQSDPLYKALGGEDGLSPLGGARKASQKAKKRVLVLSGGSHWGAFGAGFLKARQSTNPEHYDAVSGVSTGALQALLIGVGGFDLLENEYQTIEQHDLIKTGSVLTALTSGYMNNTDPLRKRLEALLCKSDVDCPGLEKLAMSKTEVFAGSVELATGNFQSRHLTAMARAGYGKDENRSLTPKQAQQCIVAAIMGSIAMPAFLRPARVNGKVFVDGGVRLSVFEAVLGSYAQDISDRQNSDVEIDVVRNGPTVLRLDERTDDDSAYKTDAKPDIGRVAYRSYSAIVNQTEVMSLAGLRLSRPTGTIRYITADGFKASGNCWPNAKYTFDADFMRCLVRWGRTRAQGGWRSMPLVGAVENGRAAPRMPNPKDQ